MDVCAAIGSPSEIYKKRKKGGGLRKTDAKAVGERFLARICGYNRVNVMCVLALGKIITRERIRVSENRRAGGSVVVHTRRVGTRKSRSNP